MAVGAAAIIQWTDAKAMFAYDDTEQTRVESLIDIVTARCEKYCGRDLMARDYTELASLESAGSSLILDHVPINTITSINIDPARAFAAGTIIAASGYAVRRRQGIVVRYGSDWPAGVDHIQIVYNAGYATTDAEYPALKGAALEFLSWLKARMSTGVGRKSEITADGASVGYEIDMPQSVRVILDGFKI